MRVKLFRSCDAPTHGLRGIRAVCVCLLFFFLVGFKHQLCLNALEWASL